MIISIGRLETTADADGEIGRSSQLDHSKELDLYFSELYWSSFLGSVQKNRYRNKMAYRKKCVCMFSHGKGISARKSAFRDSLQVDYRDSFLWRTKLAYFGEA